MKLVTAIVKPFKLDDVKNALELMGIAGLTIAVISFMPGSPLWSWPWWRRWWPGAAPSRCRRPGW